MKTIIAFALLSVSTFAQAEVKLNCWDGSFGYNYVHAKETARGVEISLEGSTLGLPALYDSWSHSILIDGFHNQKPRLHALLPLESKVENSNGDLTLSAKTIVSETPEGFFVSKHPTLWLEHDHVSLGQSKRLITDIPLQTLEVKLSDEQFTLSFKQDKAPGEPALETVTVGCSMTTNARDLEFPADLKSFLDSAK